MKEKYYLLFLFATGFAMANGQIETYDVFEERSSELFDPKGAIPQENIAVEKDVFLGNGGAFGGEGIFENINPVFEQKSGNDGFEEPKTRVVAQQKTLAPAPLKVIPTNKDGAMLKIKGDILEINPKVLNSDKAKLCTQLVKYNYDGTKRCGKEERVFPGAFLEGNLPPNLPRPSLYEILKKEGIENIVPIWGTNGGKEGGVVGMLACRRTAGCFEIFVIFEGSQGESFEFLGGIGGASWRSNFQAGKVKVKAETLGLDKKYGQLSFHEGYYNKIMSMKISLEEKLYEMFSRFGIKSFSEFSSANANNITQQDVDNKRGCHVVLYILGHSQGGGLTQIGAPYATTFIGRWLYGDSFDNKTFNIGHAICMSPARAIGDEYTLNVIKDVMGEGNILGWCSPIDCVPCLPLGDNINKRPIEKINLAILSFIIKGIAVFLHEPWRGFVSAVLSAKNNFKEIMGFAYVDHGKILERYCDIGIKVWSDYLAGLQNKKDQQSAKKEIEKFKQIKEKIPQIKSIITEMQENYFKAHTSKALVSKAYAVKAILSLRKLLKVLPIGDLIASQHLGAPVILRHPKDPKKIWVETLFYPDLLDVDMQKEADRGTEYNRRKNSLIKFDESSKKIGR